MPVPVLVARIGLGRRLRSLSDDGLTVGRVGGDQFVVLLPNATPSAAEHKAAQLRNAMEGGDLLQQSLIHHPLPAAELQALLSPKELSKSELLGSEDRVRPVFVV